MALRAAHGTGADALVRVETTPPDELPPLDAQDTAQGLASADRRGRPFERGNRAAAGRRPALATVCGMPLDASDPAYRKALGWARRYRGRRVRELTIQHGGALSAGVCAMITSSALDMAASRYLAAKAAQTGDVALMLTASRLAQSSRQQELTALEVAQREGAARPRLPVDPMAAIRSRLSAPVDIDDDEKDEPS
ncbi:MAG TPA: hypothetical protein VKU41_27775 [Polyangiaceae bacterium]|nr:hypothetical protein [Polyangiaceae bacterium]